MIRGATIGKPCSRVVSGKWSVKVLLCGEVSCKLQTIKFSLLFSGTIGQVILQIQILRPGQPGVLHPLSGFRYKYKNMHRLIIYIL